MKRQERMEFATTGGSGGAEGAVQFLRALAARPDGRPPVGRNGRPQSWSRDRGFHDGDRLGDERSFAERLAKLTARAEAESRRRRAERAQREREAQESRRETDALIARAERKLEASMTTGGQLVAAMRRGL